MQPSYNSPVNDELTQLIKGNGITTWANLTHFVTHLPYKKTPTNHIYL